MTKNLKRFMKWYTKSCKFFKHVKKNALMTAPRNTPSTWWFYHKCVEASDKMMNVLMDFNLFEMKVWRTAVKSPVAYFNVSGTFLKTAYKLVCAARRKQHTKEV